MDTDFENRIVTPDYSPEDVDLELSLRPRSIDDYIGQEKVKENLNNLLLISDIILGIINIRRCFDLIDGG